MLFDAWDDMKKKSLIERFKNWACLIDTCAILWHWKRENERERETACQRTIVSADTLTRSFLACKIETLLSHLLHSSTFHSLPLHYSHDRSHVAFFSFSFHSSSFLRTLFFTLFLSFSSSSLFFSAFSSIVHSIFIPHSSLQSHHPHSHSQSLSSHPSFPFYHRPLSLTPSSCHRSHFS